MKTTGVPAFLAEKFAVPSAADFVKTVDAVLSQRPAGCDPVAPTPLAKGQRKR